MKSSTAANMVATSYSNIATITTAAHVQAAETLEEINQKTATLRDQFALVAMGQLIAGYSKNHGGGPFMSDSPKEIAEFAYKYADAMLTERNK